MEIILFAGDAGDVQRLSRPCREPALQKQANLVQYVPLLRLHVSVRQGLFGKQARRRKGASCRVS